MDTGLKELIGAVPISCTIKIHSVWVRIPSIAPISPTKCRRSSLERLISFYDSCRNSRKLSESTTYQTILWEVVSKGKLLSFKMKTRHNPVVILGTSSIIPIGRGSALKPHLFSVRIWNGRPLRPLQQIYFLTELLFKPYVKGSNPFFRYNLK